MLRGLEQAAIAGHQAVLYLHPWEFDPQTPRRPLSWMGRLRTYSGLKKAQGRLQRVMHLPGRWTPITGVLYELGELAHQRLIFEL